MKLRVLSIGSIVLFILLIPLIAMQFTSQVNWGIVDFLIGGFILFTVGLIIELLVRKVENPKMGFILALIVLLLFILVWAELAVGIFDSVFSWD